MTHRLRIIGLGIALLIAVAACNHSSDKTISNSKTRGIPGMVAIPAGSFTMGGRSDQAYKDELPNHEVTVSGFYMDIHEVTNKQFEKFTAETGYITVAERNVDWEELKTQLPSGTPRLADSLLQAGSLIFRKTSGPVNLKGYEQWWEWKIGANWKNPQGPSSDIESKENHPVIHMAREDAMAYAKWAGKRLPTEAEWEWAASGGKQVVYPWGNEPSSSSYDKANFWQGLFPFQNDKKDGHYLTAPVKSYTVNPYGLHDMAGNVWEWCSDRYSSEIYNQANKNSASINPQGPSKSYNPSNPYGSESYVIRGGSYLCNDVYCSGYRVSRRMGADANSSTGHIGFRCVKDLD